MQTQYVEVGVFWQIPSQKKSCSTDLVEKDVAVQKRCLDVPSQMKEASSQMKEASHTVSCVGLIQLQKCFSLKDPLRKMVLGALPKHL